MFSITARIRYTASALTQNRLWPGLTTIERCSEIKGKFTEAVSNFSSLWDCCPLNDSSPQPFWFRGHYCPFLCQLQSDWLSLLKQTHSSIFVSICLNNELFGGVRVLEYMGINQSFFRWVSAFLCWCFHCQQLSE